MRNLLLTACLLLAPAAAVGCSCATAPPPTDALSMSAAVFSGRVVHAEPRDGEERAFTYTIEVYAVWKGVHAAEVQVETSDTAMCGLWLEEGNEYLVYANGTAEALSVNNCSRSRWLALADDDLEELGSPQAVPARERSIGQMKSAHDTADDPDQD